MPGRCLNHYRILEKLGEGGMGEVYRAHDETLDRDVAIKLLRTGECDDAGARARLIREARAAAALNHPNICTIHEVGEADGQAFIAMELVEGRTLSAIASREPLSVETVLQHGIQIADALAHAHDRHIVHRDLKSANVVITADGRAKVLDFGLAMRLRERARPDASTRDQADASLTGPGTLAGTLAYMSPEQLRGGSADERSDIWALGVMLYELASGARPFQGGTGFELTSRILSQPAPPLPSSVPVELRAVIERCLAREPGQRYQRAGEARAAMEAVRAGTTTWWTSLRYRVSRRRASTLTVAAAVLLAAVASLVPGPIHRWLLGAPRLKSVAILPFENLSGDPAQDYLASGLHETLITDLSRLSGLQRVTARSSVKRYEGTSLAPREIARQLGVEALVTGTVVRSGNRVQITAHLLSASEAQLWSNRYDREFRDIFSLQNEIVSALIREINVRLTPVEEARLNAGRAVNPDAFEACLQGRFYRRKQTREDANLAERYYRLALEKDPTCALAYAGLGDIWLMRGDAGIQAPAEAFPKGMAFLSKALELDDSSAEVHVSLGNHKNAAEWDWPGAEAEFKRALQLNPNLADAHFFYADMLMVLKRTAEWKPEMDRTRELDPLNDFNESYYGWHLNYLHRYDEAIPIFRKLLATGPNKGSNYLGLWGAYYRTGRFDEALSAAASYFSAIGEQDFAAALGAERGEAAYRRAMRRAGELMAAQSAGRHVPAIRVARMFAHAGDADSAILWLEKAYRARESPLIRLAVFWDWDSLRADPRFQDLMRRLKLPL